jgi:hypothetical protein
MVEVIIVAVLVLWSSLVVFKKVFPQTAFTVFSKLSQFCQSHGWTTLSRWLKPQAVAGCGGNCACPTNENQAEKKVDSPQAVKWK